MGRWKMEKYLEYWLLIVFKCIAIYNLDADLCSDIQEEKGENQVQMLEISTLMA